jgi:DNA primase
MTASMFTGAPDKPTYPTQFIEELHTRVPQEPLIGRTFRLKRSGRSWRARCPLHGGKGLSFSVFSQGWRCFACGEHGDAFGWLKVERLDFSAAVTRLADETGVPSIPLLGPDGAQLVDGSSGNERYHQIITFKTKEARERNRAVLQPLLAAGIARASS